MRKLFILFCIPLFLSCSKETRLNHVQGIVFKNCSEPLVQKQILLKANIGQSITSPDILAGATTDTRGRFDFTYELKENKSGLGNIQMVDQDGFTTLFGNLTLNKDQNLVLFLENEANLTIELGGNKVFGAQDTLYYSSNYSSLDYFSIQPKNGFLANLNASVPNTNGESVNAVFYYGIGLVDFKLAGEASMLQDSSYQNINVALGGCFRTDSLLLTID